MGAQWLSRASAKSAQARERNNNLQANQGHSYWVQLGRAVAARRGANLLQLGPQEPSRRR